MLKQRIITALLLLPLVGYVLFGLDLKLFTASLLVVNYLMAWEWARLSGVSSRPLMSVYAVLVSLVSIGLWYFGPKPYFWPSPWFIEWYWISTLVAYWIAVFSWAIAIFMIITAAKTKSLWSGSPWFRMILGGIILNGFWISAVALRNTDFSEDSLRGGFLVLFMLAVIWGADVGGYIFGKLFGKHKLALSISPGKTWEGFFGGLGLSLIVAFIGGELLDLQYQSLLIFIIAIIALVVLSVFGDLFISLLKRQVNLKDTSNLLPGHGGILDRLDSTLAVTPFFLLLATALEWI